MKDSWIFAPAPRRSRSRRPHPLIPWLGLVAVASIAIAGTSPPAQRDSASKAGEVGRSERRLVTKRGEVVDYYCYIEKGLKGPAHRECGVKCVAGDVCMGILTTEDELYMISVNHIRAMTPNTFSGAPDPFDKCRRLISEQVELTGYAMERKGQRIIEIMDVKRLGGDPQ